MYSHEIPVPLNVPLPCLLSTCLRPPSSFCPQPPNPPATSQLIISPSLFSFSPLRLSRCGVQYYKQTETYKVTLHYMNTTLTGLFTLECVMKIFSFGFRVRSDNKTSTNVNGRRRIVGGDRCAWSLTCCVNSFVI